MKILAVDDDPIARSTLFEALRISGYDNTTLAESGPDALHRIRAADSPFECFLFDIQMDGMDGIELCRTVRQMPEYRETPILMVTARHEKSWVDAAFAAGATDYVTKPFDMLELGTRVRIAEGVSAKVREIARQELKISALSRQMEALERHAPAEYRIMAPGFVRADEFELRLGRMPRAELLKTSLVACTISGFHEIKTASDEAGLVALLEDVASAIANAFEGRGLMATYGGQGIFMLAFPDHPPTESEQLAAQQTLNQLRLGHARGWHGFIALKFRDPVLFNQLSAEDPAGLVRAEMRSAAPPPANLHPAQSERPAPRREPATAQQQLEQRLRKMVPHYLGVLNQSLARLDVLGSALWQDTCTPDEIGEVGRIAHKIAGVAPTLGFAELGELASRTERAASMAETGEGFENRLALLQAPLEKLLDCIEDTIVNNLGDEAAGAHSAVPAEVAARHLQGKEPFGAP